MDSSKILHNVEDHQVLFVGGLNMRTTNPIWRTAVILKRSIILRISATVWLIATRLACRRILTFEPCQPLNICELLKIQDGGRQLV